MDLLALITNPNGLQTVAGLYTFVVAIMTIIKSGKLQFIPNVLEILPKKWRFIVPMLIGAVGGAIAWFVTGMEDSFISTVTWGFLVGSGSIVPYQTLKGFDWTTKIAKVLGTVSAGLEVKE